MQGFTKIALIIVIILTVLTMFVNLWDYKNIYSLVFIIIATIFNVSLFFVLVLAANEIIKISKRNSIYFLFCLIISFLFFWYVISILFKFFLGSFLSLGGVFFYIATRTLLMKISFIIAVALIIFSFAILLFLYSKKHFDNKKTPKFAWAVVSVIIIVLFLLVIPKSYFHQMSPITDFFGRFMEEKDVVGNFSQTYGEKILDIDVTEKLNLVIILLESISASHVYYYGYERNITPNIDWLAKNGIVFTQAHSSSTHSDHAQPSFLSSRYTLINNYRNFFGDNYSRTFPWDILKEGGYETAFISAQNENWANIIEYYKKDNLDLFWYSLSDEKYDYGSGQMKNDYDEVAVNKSIEWLEEVSEPFFLYVNMQATHYPYSYPEHETVFLPDKTSFFESYFYIPDGELDVSINKYDNSLYYVDKQIGVLKEYLIEKDLLDNTIVILTSDHGEVLNGTHGRIRHGFGVYEEEVHVPLIFFIPGQEHKVVNDRVRTIDSIPTVLSLLGFQLSEDFQGREMGEEKDIFLFCQNQNFKIGLIRGDIKYIIDKNTGMKEAYNLTLDPKEENNLIKNKKNDSFFQEYEGVLKSWYNCQLDYYKNEKWKQGEKIAC